LVALVQENCVAFNSMHTSAASQCARRCKRARLLAADHRACPRSRTPWPAPRPNISWLRIH
jgi:hypothetical protein